MDKRDMVLTLDDLTVHVPKQFVEEYKKLLKSDEKQVFEYLSDYMRTYRKSMIDGNDFRPETFEQEFIHYLEGDLDIFRS